MKINWFTEKLRIAPNGEAITLQPKYEIFIATGCGTKKDFFKQEYVKNIITEVQHAKKSREEGAAILGLDYEGFVKEVRKQNEKDGLSDYEQIRQENIAKRKICIRHAEIVFVSLFNFSSLGFPDFSSFFSDSTFPER